MSKECKLVIEELISSRLFMRDLEPWRTISIVVVDSALQDGYP
jgi:hypothetical protein